MNEIQRILKEAVVLQIFMLFCCLHIIFCFAYRVPYGLYLLTQTKWSVTNAKIEEVEAILSNRPRGSNEIVNVIEIANIRYTYESCLYDSKVPFAYTENEGDIIRVAVYKDDPRVCVRVEWLPFQKSTKMLCYMESMYILLFIVIKVLLNKRDTSHSVIVISSDGKPQEQVNDCNDAIKVRKIQLLFRSAWISVGVLELFICALLFLKKLVMGDVEIILLLSGLFCSFLSVDIQIKKNVNI